MRDVSEDYVEVNLEQELCESNQNPEQASENIEQVSEYEQLDGIDHVKQPRK